MTESLILKGSHLLTVCSWNVVKGLTVTTSNVWRRWLHGPVIATAWLLSARTSSTAAEVFECVVWPFGTSNTLLSVVGFIMIDNMVQPLPRQLWIGVTTFRNFCWISGCVSHGYAPGIFQDWFWFHKVCTLRVPEQLTGEHKRNHTAICQGRLNRYHKDGDSILRRIFIRDETWIHYCVPESKRQGMERKHLTSRVKKVFRTRIMDGISDVDTFGGGGGFARTNFVTMSREVENSKQYRL
jgi:hypothetical protein